MKRPRATIAAVRLILSTLLFQNNHPAFGFAPPLPLLSSSSGCSRVVRTSTRSPARHHRAEEVVGSGPRTTRAGRRRRVEYYYSCPPSEVDDDEEGGERKHDANSNNPNNDLSGRISIVSRRTALLIASSAAAAASLAFLPPMATAIADPLEELSLGTATWSDAQAYSASSSQQQRSSSSSGSAIVPLSARIVPPSFATYLSRFLLHYDAGASAWWGDQSDSYSLLPSNDARKREGKSFGSYASSIQRGLYSYVSGSDGTNIRSYAKVRAEYATLLTSLMDKYGSQRGAIRDIALLFAMLPAVYQPTDVLLRMDKAAMKTATGTTNNEGGKNNEDSSFPPNFQSDFTLLLPNKYMAVYAESTESFVIAPDINLFEIGIEEDGSGSIAIATTFGPLSSRPLMRERNLSLDVYALLGVAGGLGCATTHTLVIPLDVVKTRLQTNPGRYDNIFDGARKIARDEGMSALLLGAQATIVGYLWYGISVYPSYSFFKRYIGGEVLSSAFALAHTNDVALVAGALASVVASIGLTPTEACRIRTVAQPEIYRDMGLLGTLNVIRNENAESGWKNLYSGLPSLMARQVIFGSVKFLTFERASDAIFAQWPELRYATYTALGASLAAGGIAGVLSSIVSQPADSVLTFVAKRGAAGGLGMLDGAKMMVEEEGLGSLFRGLGSRSVWAGCIIAGQFLLYDVFRAFFGISGEDLTQVFELVVMPKIIV